MLADEWTNGFNKGILLGESGDLEIIFFLA